MNDERERRQTIYRLEFDFHAIDIGKWSYPQPPVGRLSNSRQSIVSIRSRLPFET